MILWLIVAALLADPKAVIEGPSQANAGDLVILDAAKSVGTGHIWKLVGSDKSYLPVDGGLRCVFASGAAGRYTFVLAVADGGKAALATHTVVIGNVPPPGPIPPPNPPPTPLPDGRYKLAAKAATWAAAVPSANRPAEAALLAGAFDSVAAKAAAGVVPSVAKLLEESSAANKSALGTAITVWNEPFFRPLQSALDDLWEKGQMRTVADYAEAFREIALGVRAVTQ